MFDELSSLEIAIVASGYLALMATSGKVVNYVLFAISKKPVSRMVSKEARDTGFVVGKCENLLILTFMFLGAYTALALIFTVKMPRTLSPSGLR